MKFFKLFMLLIAFSFSQMACNGQEEIDKQYIKLLPRFKSAKDVLLKNKAVLAKNMLSLRDSTPYLGAKEVILMTNTRYFISQVLPRNQEILPDLMELHKLWDDKILDPTGLGWFTLRKNDEVEFGIKFYNGGLGDSYNHSILYCPNFNETEIRKRYESVVLLETIEQDWKYLISKSRF